MYELFDFQAYNPSTLHIPTVLLLSIWFDRTIHLFATGEHIPPSAKLERRQRASLCGKKSKDTVSRDVQEET